MASLYFSKSGQEFSLSYRMLKELALNFPSGEKYSALAADILLLGIPSISVAIIEKADLARDAADAAWQGGNCLIRRQLLKKREFARNLSDGQAQDILRANDALMLCHIAEWGQELFREREGRRISDEKAIALITAALNHPDWRPRKAVAANAALPMQFWPDLATQLDFSIPHESLRFACMKMSDLEPLGCIVDNVLFYLIEKMASIKDKAVRQAVLDFLVTSPDPGARLEFAENAGKYGKCTPEMLEGLKILADDAEPDVAAAALVSLKRQQRGEQ